MRNNARTGIDAPTGSLGKTLDWCRDSEGTEVTGDRQQQKGDPKVKTVDTWDEAHAPCQGGCEQGQNQN